MKEEPIFYGLLYVDHEKRAHANIRGNNDPLDIYLRCAVLCAKSVSYYGHTFRLITNNGSWVEDRLRQMKLGQINLVEHRFSLAVPPDLPFWAAHFKLELYRAFGSGQFGEYLGLIDIDTILISPIKFPKLGPDTILLYDITDQMVEEFGYEKIRFGLESVSGRTLPEWRWFGGEFLFGHVNSFERLAAAIFQLWPSYINNAHHLHHVGDEVLLAAAVPKTDLKVLDAGKLGVITRWWTARTSFEQIPFDLAAKRMILHLPSDKDFLAESARDQFDPKIFIARFRQMARSKLFWRRLFSFAELLLGRRQKYVGHLS